MKLYHFTSTNALRAIGRHGLTVGDVPIDIVSAKSIVGVWLSNLDKSAGHGLGGAFDKKRCRLTVDISDGDKKLKKWTEWATTHVTEDTKRRLCETEGNSYNSWFVYFGLIRPECISEVFDIQIGRKIEEWDSAFPTSDDVKGVPYWNREKWSKALNKQIGKVIEANRGGKPYRPDRQR